MSKIPLYKYNIIYLHYKDKILTGGYEPGEKLPSEMKIAEKFNVSRITATRALKELESSNLIYRVKGSGSFVNDQPNKTKNIGQEKISLISVILPSKRVAYSSDLISGIEKVAEKHDHFVTIHYSANKPTREKAQINKIISSGSRGIILYPLETYENLRLYSKLMIDKYPLVLVDKSIPGLNLPLVSTDNKEAFSKITSHLIKLGHARIIFVGTDVHQISSQKDRYEGFCDAHLQNGIPLLDDHLFTKKDFDDIASSYKSNESPERRAFNYLFDRLEGLEPDERPSAIAAVNDFLAGLIISVAQERGIQIPEQYSITGFDDSPFSSMFQVPITTYAQPISEIGREVAKELFNRIESPDMAPSIRTITGRLIIRKSTKTIEN